ncbi:pleckstriny domain containing protein [Gracilaria domingensis]|nr:pleckstriny domain containing protein [Gracilaria domingensis]
MANRYIKGRLPEGVDFAAYPGRSSTPLPTAESKSAERINQLKIWNEAATNDDKRRLGASKTLGVNATSGSTTRRTDSFKQAKDRHSASFHSTPPSNSSRSAEHRTSVRHTSVPLNRNKDMFADRSDSESEEEEVPEDYPEPELSAPHDVQQTQQVPHRPQPTTRPLSVPPPRPSNPNPVPDNPHPRPVSAPAPTALNTPDAFPPANQPKRNNACCIIM